MATLVLTAVGTALGGPLGGALGAILGQSADALLFAPKARQGPRLTDLKVQTSSYGDQIPRLYGTMRVAGTVIWATDLIERRQSRSGGKGRPKTIEYSYSSSFAVALSARRIASIKRIWADGRLLRDQSGRFAETVEFRSYSGDADQEVDPLIASDLGSARASAFRGIAYAMFEALDLSAFGNRIPQLSFEVEADARAVHVGDIGEDLLGPAVASGGPELRAVGACATHWPRCWALAIWASRLATGRRGWRRAMDRWQALSTGASPKCMPPQCCAQKKTGGTRGRAWRARLCCGIMTPRAIFKPASRAPWSWAAMAQCA
jgi:hypothetical protein